MNCSFEKSLINKLKKEFSPSAFELINESHKHHASRGGHSHFLCIIASNVFEGMSRIERQKRVLDLLKHEIQEEIHAFSMRLYTENEW